MALDNDRNRLLERIARNTSCLSVANTSVEPSDGATSGLVTLAASPDADTIDTSGVAEARCVEIILSNSTGTNISVAITKSDGSTIDATLVVGTGQETWTYCSQKNEAPITQVVLTNNTANSVDYIVNYYSLQGS